VLKADFGLTEAQLRTLAICNALTIPARIVGMVLIAMAGDYSWLLVYTAIPCLAFALAQNFDQLVYSRLALSIVGCGFVIGIRMVANGLSPEIGWQKASMAAGQRWLCDCLDSPLLRLQQPF